VTAVMRGVAEPGSVVPSERPLRLQFYLFIKIKGNKAILPDGNVGDRAAAGGGNDRVDRRRDVVDIVVEQESRHGEVSVANGLQGSQEGDRRGARLDNRAGRRGEHTHGHILVD